MLAPYRGRDMAEPQTQLGQFLTDIGNLGISTWGIVKQVKSQNADDKQRAAWEKAQLEMQQKEQAQRLSLMPFNNEQFFKMANWLSAAVAASLVALAVGKALKMKGGK